MEDNVRIAIIAVIGMLIMFGIGFCAGACHQISTRLKQDLGDIAKRRAIGKE